MFNALKHGRQGGENIQDVYCSECGFLTPVRSRNNAEGGAEAPTIDIAKPLNRSEYDLMPQRLQVSKPKQSRSMRHVVVGNSGSTTASHARIAKEKAEAKL
ncbi:hypothetical protein HD554DRAFT_2039267 [Boletus coccyginus]|nr:hypothetical protein HD554DRAFT_2039267 [Boletus coccyginus]